VRETEKLVARLLEPPKAKKASGPDRDLLRLEEELSDRLGAKVGIHANRKGAGQLSIHFASLEQLEGILDRLR
jgi:ParB family chromosome partitioning protein